MRFWPGIWAVLLLAAAPRAATVVLANGRSCRGAVERCPDGSLIVRGPGQPARSLAAGDVVRLSAADEPRAVASEWHQALEMEKDAQGGAAWLSLAKFCQLQGLMGEAAAFAARWGVPRGLKATTSRRFLVLSQAKPGLAAEVAAALEAVLDRLLADLPPPAGTSAACLVLLFSHEREAARQGLWGEVQGAFADCRLPERELVLIEWTRQGMREVLPSYIRTLVFYYLCDVYLGMSPRWPWPVEGLAGYYQGMVLKGRRVVEVKGKDLESWERLRVNLEAGTHVPLARFLKYTRQDLEAGDPYGICRDQASSLAWFLLGPGRRVTGDLLGRYLRILRESRDEERAWRETAGVFGPEKLEQAWRRAVLGG